MTAHPLTRTGTDEGDVLHGEDMDDREFIPFRRPCSPLSLSMVASAIQDLLEEEERRGVRTRKRRAVDQKTFEATVAAVLCDVAFLELTEASAWASVTFDKSVLGCGGRYRAEALSTKFPEVVRALADRQWIELEVGYHKHPFIYGRPSRRTRIRAGDLVRRSWIGAGLRMEDFELDDSEEVIILRRQRIDHRDRGGSVDYADTETTNRYRAELRRINEWLRAAPLNFLGTPSDRPVDLGDRRLRRIFNGSFERGGRLYGGFWQKLKSDERLSRLTISGAPVVELDYGQMSLRLLYGAAKVQPAWSDGYAVPGLEGHREGTKKLLNAMLNRESPLTKYPKGLRSMFPAVTPAWEAVRLIEEFHPPLRDQWRPKVGLELMFRESCILIDVLLLLADMNITALPIHDAVLVSQKHADITKGVMLEVFHRHTSIQGQVGMNSRREP